ncbi:hypothetical protein GCM10027442_22270 [Emticicia fontis]
MDENSQLEQISASEANQKKEWIKPQSTTFEINLSNGAYGDLGGSQS